jgi:phosphoribosylaminoimidazolecarboxamide formyltransferase/IMP cyclohydrolase
MKQALISVSYKTNIIPFAKALVQLGYTILSTGGTQGYLEESGIPVTSVEAITGHPEILDGRVKTLHPKIHGGLLSLRDKPSHRNDMMENAIPYIDLVCVNLYPFKQTIQDPNVSFDDAIEQIDIGGPSMLRSAAKNYQFVTVLSDIQDYDSVLHELQEYGDTLPETKKRLSAKAFRNTAQYDAIISTFLDQQLEDVNAISKTITFDAFQTLRYGENPHQKATLYQAPFNNPYSLFEAKILNGKALSYNNIQDANAAINILKEHTKPTVVALKHMNPCGVASAEDIKTAFTLAYQSDPVSIFGGIIACNGMITKEVAATIKSMFIEIIIAPEYTEEALAILKKKKHLRVLQLDTSMPNTDTQMLSSVNGGILMQDLDQYTISKSDLSVVSNRVPTDQQLDQMMFAWNVVKHVKSNAIVVTKGYQTVGIGAGQMNRVGASKIALEWAKEHGHSSDLILASDAFLPFDDVVRLASTFGVTAIIQPGGSIRDNDSIQACNELGIAMVFTGKRHFKH